MAQQPEPPVITTPIPAIVINEGAAYGPFDLKNHIQSPNDESGMLHFVAGLDSADSLPKGLICTDDGLFGGIPATGTIGDYRVVVIAENDSDDPLIAEFDLMIKPRIAIDDPTVLANLKSDVWKALGENMPIPEMDSLLNRPITAIEIYYLLQRFAVLTIWDIYNLEAPSEKTLLSLTDLNAHYHIYDRGSCLVAAPKDLFSHTRTLEHALQASRVLAREVYKRGWTIEFAGFNKMIRAAWVELQIEGDKNGKQLEIVHYSPTPDDLKLYGAQAQAKGPTI
jgi:hypothetical protein